MNFDDFDAQEQCEEYFSEVYEEDAADFLDFGDENEQNEAGPSYPAYADVNLTGYLGAEGVF